MAEHKSPVLWSPEALDDVDRIWDYHARVAGRARDRAGEAKL